MNRTTASQRTYKKEIVALAPSLFSMAYAWCHDKSLAEDMVQLSIYKALQKRKQLKDIAAVKPWLFRILSNTILDDRRSQKQTEEYLDVDHSNPADSPEWQASRDDVVTMVRNAMEKLPMRYRQVLTLVDLEAFSYLETAEILEVPIGTIMSRLNRGRKVLRQELERPSHISLVKSAKDKARK